MVFSGLVMAWRRAIWPTRTSPLSSHATTDGVRRPPSSLGMTLGSLPSMIATTEFVVPRSIPMILPMFLCPLFELSRALAGCARRTRQYPPSAERQAECPERGDGSRQGEEQRAWQVGTPSPGQQTPPTAPQSLSLRHRINRPTPAQLAG